MQCPVSALIVDDEEHLRLYLKLVLKRIGFLEISEAVDGQEAVDGYKRKRPDIVLMDVNMPVKGGMDALKEIIEHDSSAIVVMASSVVSPEVIEKSIELGASHYLRKDSPKEEIVKVLEHLVSGIAANDS